MGKLSELAAVALRPSVWSKGITLAVLGVSIVLGGCAEPTTRSTATIPSIGGARHYMDPATGVRSFRFTGFSYGPNYEERPPGGCNTLYTTRTDSMLIRPGSPPWHGYTHSIEKAGCGIGSDPGGGSYDGGRVNVSIATTSIVDLGIEADGTEFRWLDNIPRDGTIHIEALAQGGFRFLDWIVTRSDGSVYKDFSPVLDRATDTEDVEFKAEFLAF